MAVCCFWRWLSTCVDRQWVGMALRCSCTILRTVVRDVVLVAGFVDVEVAQPGSNPRIHFGHAWVALQTKEGHSFFVETTNFAYPHSGQSAKALYGEMLCEARLDRKRCPTMHLSCSSCGGTKQSTSCSPRTTATLCSLGKHGWCHRRGLYQGKIRLLPNRQHRTSS